jgi:hypothetical protein
MVNAGRVVPAVVHDEVVLVRVARRVQRAD